MTPVVQVKLQEKTSSTTAQLDDPSSDDLMFGHLASSGFFSQVKLSLKEPPGRHTLKAGPEVKMLDTILLSPILNCSLI